MQSLDNSAKAFLALVRGGLWEAVVRLSKYEPIDFSRVLTLAEEQSVVGLVAAGLEHVTDVIVHKEVILQFVGQALQLEQQNQGMNSFIGVLVNKMRQDGIYTLLIKGQGIAQCYERPLWRACGDIDFLLNEDNYPRAQSFLIPMANSVEKENENHQGMNIGSWVVEIHGNQHCGLSARMDRMIDEVQRDIFYGGNVRSWENEKTQVFLPSANDDVVLIFTHFLKHFFKGGLGMRQICDWCRLLWKYRQEIDSGLLDKRLKESGLMTEWRAFAAYAVDYLGMPVEAMPLYSPEGQWKRKTKQINRFLLQVGNMGHKRDKRSTRNKSFFVRKIVSLSQRISDFCNHAFIFPVDSLRFFPSILYNGLKSAAKGIG